QAISEWEAGREQAIKGGGLGEIDFIDSVMTHYKYKYNQLVEDLKSGYAPRRIIGCHGISPRGFHPPFLEDEPALPIA
ncbi:MAG: hypothetical protein ABSB32_12130, partial [Thermodesulfobacteriota bacterium]